MLKVPLVVVAVFTCTLTLFRYFKNDSLPDTNSVQTAKLSIFSQTNKMWKLLKRSTTIRKKMKGKDVYKSMTILFLLLIAISCDVESNPGPITAGEYLEGNSTIFPCGNCENPVTWNCKGVQCDMCEIWYHADCQNVGDSFYDRLGDSTAGIAVWKCIKCENINVTNGSIPPLDSLDSENPYSCLTSPNTSNVSFSMAQTSTPKQIKNKPMSGKLKKNNIKRSLKVQVINCRSIVDKKT
jgi:hypothetical protein